MSQIYLSNDQNKLELRESDVSPDELFTVNIIAVRYRTKINNEN